MSSLYTRTHRNAPTNTHIRKRRPLIEIKIQTQIKAERERNGVQQAGTDGGKTREKRRKGGSVHIKELSGWRERKSEETHKRRRRGTEKTRKGDELKWEFPGLIVIDCAVS